MRLKTLRAFFLSLALTAVVSLLSLPTLAQGTTTLTWSIEGVPDLGSLDPAKASNAQDFQVIGLIYGGLVRLDDKLRVVPDLAESWTISDDGLTYTFKMRDGALFSDGSPITADDAVWGLRHALDPSSTGTGEYYLSNIVGADEVYNGKAQDLTGAVAVDKQTVKITIKQPSAYFLSQLSFGSARVISKAAADANPQWDQNPVASGPFQIKEWNHGQNIVLVPNTNYWQPPTNISTLTMPFFQDSETAYQLYRTDQLDIMGSQQNPIPAGHIAEVKDLPDFHSGANFATRYVGFNNELKPFDNVDARRAFALAIDKETLANTVLNGAVVATDRILPAGFPGSELPIKGLKFDPQAAKDALAKAGVTADSIGKVTLTYGVEGDNERVVTVLQSMWKENLGVDVTLEPLELATFSSRLDDTYQHPDSGLQMYYSIWGADYPDPQNFISLQLHTGVGANNGHWSNAQFDALVDKADVTTTSFDDRLKLYNQAEQIAVDEVGWLPLFNPAFDLLMKPYVKGIAITGQGLIIADYTALSGRPSS